jgi:hypothetical protein
MDSLKLLVDDVKIVQHPLGCRCDRAVLTSRLRDRGMTREQDAAVSACLGGEVVSAPVALIHRLPRRKTFGVRLQPLCAVDLAADCLVDLARARRSTEASAEDTQGLQHADLFPADRRSGTQPCQSLRRAALDKCRVEPTETAWGFMV